MSMASWTRRLCSHCGAIVTLLGHSDEKVREDIGRMLGNLDAASLALHWRDRRAARDFAASVRKAAMDVLGRLDAASLALHSGAIAARLEDSDARVRRAALRAWQAGRGVSGFTVRSSYAAPRAL